MGIGSNAVKSGGKHIGILGGGQLARMLVLAGVPLGLRFRCFDVTDDAPAGEVCELHTGSFDDKAALDRFCAGLDIVTYEFENIPIEAVRHVATRVRVHPDPKALEIGQDRLFEKTFCLEKGMPVHAFRACQTRIEFDDALKALGLPVVIKTRRMGYDGKGQAVARTAAEADAAWNQLGSVPLLVEAFVPFVRELSAIAVRGVDGSTVVYDWVENEHRKGILRLSVAPAGAVPEALSRRTREQIVEVMAALNYVGVMAMEFFDDGERLLLNEIAPRVHNSGHWTIEGALTSQFSNHCRAIAGLPLGRSDSHGVSAMVNFIGAIPQAARVLSVEGASLHEYGKQSRPGRKVGHATIVAATRDAKFDGAIASMRALAEEAESSLNDARVHVEQ